MLQVDTLLYNNAGTPEEHSNIVTQSMIDAIKACARINSQSFLIIDFDQHLPVFMTDSLLYIDDATAGDFKRQSPNPYWSLVSDEILASLIKMRNLYFNLREMMTKEEYGNHVCIVDYPISIKGKEFYINSRYTPLALRADGQSRLGLFSITPSCRSTMTCIITSSSARRWTYDFEKCEFREYELRVKLSITEKAIIQRAKKGMSNEEIAEDLYLSINTVKTHRLHIFKKLNVETITEALLVVGDYHLL